MTRGTLKICTLLLVLFLAAPPAFCIQCCCTADEPVSASSEAPHGCCVKPQQEDTIPAFTAEAACDCPDLYEPMLAVASGATGDSNDSSRVQTAALVVDCVTVARPWTDGLTHRPTPPPEVERRQYASLPARAPPAVSV